MLSTPDGCRKQRRSKLRWNDAVTDLDKLKAQEGANPQWLVGEPFIVSKLFKHFNAQVYGKSLSL